MGTVFPFRGTRLKILQEQANISPFSAVVEKRSFLCVISCPIKFIAVSTDFKSIVEYDMLYKFQICHLSEGKSPPARSSNQEDRTSTATALTSMLNVQLSSPGHLLRKTSSSQEDQTSPPSLDSEEPSSNSRKSSSARAPASSLLETRERSSIAGSSFLNMKSMDC